MYASCNFVKFHVTTTTIPKPKASPFMHRRKRARLKRQTRSLFLVNSSILPPPLDSVATSLAAGFASGLAVYLSSRLISGRRRRSIVDWEWILFTTPTPFNRFVFLRCSLLSFDDSDSLSHEERHFVTLSEKIVLSNETPLDYQRLCISTEDGGVVSLDWPANLDIREEHGLDTTVIFIPGTPQGSMDEGVRSFVCQALRRGVFPVVMNPRGCAGSPLTTPRLFTAGDSDDISTALRFLTKTRPWTTLTAVARGYGANMLTKYLAEAGETTPLTAAVCIDNPFDLEEITRTSPYSTTLDQQLTPGLVDILMANKELFQGRSKAFDVQKALSSKSVREFDKALSMVTYGCESIQDFYSSCATRDVIGEVKVPVLFIQNDDIVPPYTISRSSIAENPFTSLLLCSSSPNLFDGYTMAVSWCQDLAIEWLAAVELGLLKGRHPLLKDVDVTVNPSKGLVFSEARAPEQIIGAKKLVQAVHKKTVNGYRGDPLRETLEDSDITPNSNLSSGTNLEKNVKIDHGSDETKYSRVSTSRLVEVESIEDSESDVEESERGQVLQTAEVVVNILDVTMPGTLKAEEKKK